MYSQFYHQIKEYPFCTWTYNYERNKDILENRQRLLSAVKKGCQIHALSVTYLQIKKSIFRFVQSSISDGHFCKRGTELKID